MSDKIFSKPILLNETEKDFDDVSSKEVISSCLLNKLNIGVEPTHAIQLKYNVITNLPLIHVIDVN